MIAHTELQDRESFSHRVGDAVAHGTESTIVGLLAAMCRWFVVTPESIKSHKPGERGNAPPATGGFSSLG